jgi:hypothetical protein
MMWDVGNLEVSYGMNDFVTITTHITHESWIYIQCALHKWKTFLTSLQTLKTIKRKV